MSFYYQIFGWILKTIYTIVSNNYALALIVFTLFFRLILLPSTISQQKGAAKQMRMQAKVNRIQEKYKDYRKADKQQLIQQETQELYQKEGYSSMTGGCLPLLIQLPVMWGLYGAVYRPLSYILEVGNDALSNFAEIYKNLTGDTLDVLKSGSTKAEMLILEKFNEIAPQVDATYQGVVESVQNFISNFEIFGIPLYATPSINTLKNFGASTTQEKLLLLIPILSALTSLMTSLLTQKRQEKNNPAAAAQAKQMSCMMMLMMPAMSLWITFSLPAAVGIYWIISNVIAFLQTLILGYTHAPRKVLAKLMVEETVERRSKEENTKLMAKNNNIEN